MSERSIDERVADIHPESTLFLYFHHDRKEYEANVTVPYREGWDGSAPFWVAEAFSKSAMTAISEAIDKAEDARKAGK